MSTSITIHQEKTCKNLTQKSFTMPNNNSLKHSLFFVTFFIAILIFLQLKALQYPINFEWPVFPTTTNRNITSMLQDSVTFLPLKDLRFSEKPESGHTWFMSSINDTFHSNDSEYLHFPSDLSNGRLLCLSAQDRSDGGKNSYAFAWREALPRGATLLPGLTYVSDTYYDHDNLWHGLNAIVPFISWYMRTGCVAPLRWVLFHWGELRVSMGSWVKHVAANTIGEVNIEKFEGIEGPACFEEAVVFRHNHGSISKMRLREVYDTIRCKTRNFCQVDMDNIRSDNDVRITMFLRTGARSFRNESIVVHAFKEECRKAKNCKVKVAKTDNLSFCDQVRLMSETDILVTPHGAQMTNIIFMDRNSSVMEFYPKGWEELAGVGQYVYKWIADWAGMNYQGTWRDTDGPPCSDPSDRWRCFSEYKDRQIGHDLAYFSEWMRRVVVEMKAYKKEVRSKGADSFTSFCQSV